MNEVDRGRDGARRVSKRPLLLGGGCAALLGVALLAAATVAPDTVATAYGTVRDAVTQAETTLSGRLPSVELGASGGEAVLDRCDGTFTRMVSYERAGVLPVCTAGRDNSARPAASVDKCRVVPERSTGLFRHLAVIP